MKKRLMIFLVVMLGLSTLADCGTEGAKNSAGTKESGNVQAGSGKVENISADAAKASPIPKIRLRFNGGEAIAELYDNPTSRDLVSMLPLTLTFKDFNSTEKISYLPRSLTTDKAPKGFKPSVGDLTLYAPWGNLAIFYHDFRYSQGLVPIGHLTSGLEPLARMNGELTVTIETVNE